MENASALIGSGLTLFHEGLLVGTGILQPVRKGDRERDCICTDDYPVNASIKYSFFRVFTYFKLADISFWIYTGYFYFVPTNVRETGSLIQIVCLIAIVFGL